MCNNVVALGNATADGSVLFGKNSDREPNEAHHLLHIPAATHAPGSRVRCTYVEIPQVEYTHAVLLAKPCWIWGAEIGANDQGLVIGNTAIFTRDEVSQEPGLIGMDFLRLALERAATARAALNLITGLLETYGQGGNDGFAYKLFYHNSFLIADARDAWVLETSGRRWIARQVKDVAATSNSLTIGTDYDLHSPDLIQHAVARGWCKDPAHFNFKESYGGPGWYVGWLYSYFGQAEQRQARLIQLLNQYKGQLTPTLVMTILRDHGPKAATQPGWSPAPSLFTNTVCMHAGAGPFRPDQTAGSMVSRLTPDSAIHWLTGGAAPCTSLFKPVWLDTGLPETGPAPTGRYNHTSLWWRHESLHRELLQDYAHRMADFIPQRDALEQAWVEEALRLANQSAESRRALSVQSFTHADTLTERLTAHYAAQPVQSPPGWLYRRAWHKFNRQCSFISGDPEAHPLPPLG